MPQINETLMDFFLMNSCLFIFFLDGLTLLDEVDDSLLVYNNVLLLIYCIFLSY